VRFGPVKTQKTPSVLKNRATSGNLQGIVPIGANDFDPSHKFWTYQPPTLPKDSRQKPDFALTTSLKFLLASLGLAIDHFYGAKNSTFGFGIKMGIAQDKKNLKSGNSTHWWFSI
jgi:hypothetical protein